MTLPVPAWPFVLVKPASYVNGVDVPTAIELNKLQEQVAVAADGRMWTDFSLYKSWTKADVVGTDTLIGTYDPASRRWILYDTTPGDGGYWSISGCKWLGTANASVDAFLYPVLGVGALLANVAGVILAGGQPATATNLKLSRSTDGAVTFARIAIGASNTNTVLGLGYSQSLVMWHAGVSAEGIFSSSDGGITWVNRFATPFCNFMARDGASPLLLAMRKPNAGANADYATSTNGTAWTARTFPVNLVSAGGVAADGLLQGVYNEYLGKFFQPTPSGIYSSPDGIAWTLVTASYTTGGLAVSGRVMLRGDGKASLDGAAWWPVLEAANNNLVVVASPFGGACMVDNATEERFVSLQGGF